MAKVIAGMTISLDGFVADEAGSADRLYTDLAALQDTSYMNGLIEATGAVLMGKRAFEMGDPDTYVGNYEFQVPIFVLTHHPPQVTPKQDGRLTFTFVTEGVGSAVAQARVAAGDKAVHVIGGANVIQQLLRAGLVDELHVDVMPVLLGAGLRLFENEELKRLALEKIDVQEIGIRTSLRFSVERGGKVMNERTDTAATAKEGTLVIERVFAAPRELVWKAWTEPDLLMRWWGPKGFTAPVGKIDFRVGGRFLVAMQSPDFNDGEPIWSTGVYREIIPHERIVCTDCFADENGNVVPASHYGMTGDFPLEMLITVAFEDHDGKTKMTLRHEGLPAGEHTEGAGVGWNESFDKLAASLG